MSKYIYLVFGYRSDDEHKFCARFVQLHKNTNLLSEIAFYSAIRDYEHGETARVRTITYFDTKKQALDTCEAWNKTWKDEDRLFSD